MPSGTLEAATTLAAGTAETAGGVALVTIAAITLSLAPADFRAISPPAVVSYAPGEELMVETIKSSERPALQSLMIESLFIVSAAMSREQEINIRDAKTVLNTT